MKKLSLILFSLAALLFTTQLYSEEKFISGYSGSVKVIDGDTIELGGEKIRLHGIDAPEIKQVCRNKHDSPYMCGIIAKNYLIDLIRRRGVNEQKKVYCYYSERDKYKRIIGKCFIGADSRYHINLSMVRTGNAVAYTKYSKDYLVDQDNAKIMGAGIWQGKFDLPEEWRKKNK